MDYAIVTMAFNALLMLVYDADTITQSSTTVVVQHIFTKHVSKIYFILDIKYIMFFFLKRCLTTSVAILYQKKMVAYL